ncbi:nuclear transport factor 2 family protein [Stappia sp. BW2]|nr:nuclear transport factor 2 family protein [Stappia sp. BW2]
MNDTSMTRDETYNLLHRMFAAFTDPRTAPEDFAEFLTPDYVQRVDGKHLGYSEFLKHHQSLKENISSGSIRFEHFVTDGISAATVHIAEAVKPTGERMRFKVIAYYQFHGKRVCMVDELTYMLKGEPEDLDLGSRVQPR